ncbi:MAG: inositol monophosphatase family protein [Phycisphaerales bacterium]|nr:inositol monophosphatase family protein [Phycisphaerales bacterium]
MDSAQLREILAFARDAAIAAGEFTLRHFHRDVSIEYKADQSPVTIADRGAEELLRERIARAFPSHGILGEEFGETRGRDPARWILDPVDGTYSFVRGVPLYCNLIGFEWQGEAVAGVIHMPALGEMVVGARGLGASWCVRGSHGGGSRGGWTERPARVSDVRELSQACVIATGVKNQYKFGRGAIWERVMHACQADRGWSDGYAYALLATGRVEVVLDPKMAIWDTAALLPVVTEAGGTITDWTGRPTHDGGEAIGTNGHLLDHVMEMATKKSDK